MPRRATGRRTRWSNGDFTQTKLWVGTAVKPTASTQVIVTLGRDLDVRNGYKEARRVNVRLLKSF